MEPLDNIGYWKLLLALSRTGELGKAAESLGLDLALASRMIHRAEKHYGIDFLDRTARPCRPTAALEPLLPMARKIVRAKNEADRLVLRLRAGHPAGQSVFRVSIPINSSRESLINALFNFERKHRDVRIEVLADQGQGLLDGSVDVAYLGYMLEDRRVFSIPLPDAYSCLLASRRYLSEHGEPRAVQELSRHVLLARNPSNRSFSRLLFKGRESYVLADDTRISFADPAACRDGLLKGKGIAVDLSFGYVAEELAKGVVVPVLSGWHRSKWQESVCCREALKWNTLARELMQAVRDAVCRSFMDKWTFWYDRLGIDRKFVEETASGPDPRK